LTAIGRLATHTQIMASEIALEGILRVVLPLLCALITVVVEIIAAIVVAAAEAVLAHVLIVAVIILDQMVVIGVVHVAALLSCGIEMVPVEAVQNLPAAVHVVAIISVWVRALSFTQQPVAIIATSILLLCPLRAVLRTATHTNVKASEIALVSRLRSLLVLCRAILCVVIPPVTAVVVTAAELMRAQVVKVIALGIFHQRVIIVLHMALLTCGSVFVVPFCASDHVSATLLLATTTSI
jgi:hypothetical protein